MYQLTLWPSASARTASQSEAGAVEPCVKLARSDDDNINSNAATLLCQMVLAEAADGLQGFGEGDLLRLQLDTRSDAAGRAGVTLASTRSVLTIFLNGIEHAGYVGVPDGWHFAVGGHGGVAFEIVEPTKCVIL